MTLALFGTLGAVLGIVVLASWSAQDALSRYPQLVAGEGPEKFAQSIIANSDAHLIAAVDGSTLKIKYQIDSWGLTKWTMKSAFERQAKELVPAIFSQFIDIDDVQIMADAKFQTTRGGEYREPVLRIEFTRRNAATVHWDKVTDDNVPEVANEFWQDPAFNRP